MQQRYDQEGAALVRACHQLLEHRVLLLKDRQQLLQQREALLMPRKELLLFLQQRHQQLLSCKRWTPGGRAQ